MPKHQRYQKTVTVACVNWVGVWGNKAANLEKIKAKIVEAAAAGANIIAFPELALSGYECTEEARREQKPCSMHLEAAEPIPGPSTEELAKLTKEHGVYVILGMPERDAKKPAVRYISAAVIGPEGILGSYRKVNLVHWPVNTESICFKPGNELPVFDTEYGLIGVQICRDFWLAPECTRILFLKGAQIVFNVTAAGPRPGAGELIIQQTACRAAESIIYTASANHAGKERTLSFQGHSAIAGPSLDRRSKIFAQGAYDEEIVMATLNLESLEYTQSIFEVRKHINWKLIAREYAQLAGIDGKDS